MLHGAGRLMCRELTYPPKMAIWVIYFLATSGARLSTRIFQLSQGSHVLDVSFFFFFARHDGDSPFFQEMIVPPPSSKWHTLPKTNIAIAPENRFKLSQKERFHLPTKWISRGKLAVGFREGVGVGLRYFLTFTPIPVTCAYFLNGVITRGRYCWWKQSCTTWGW